MSSAQQATTALTLRKYQVEGVNFLRAHPRAALHDAPGLGKTLQAIHAADTPVLIVCPTYLMHQWQDAILEDCPNPTTEADISIAEGTRLTRQKAIASNALWTIINVEMLRDYPLLRPYKTIIFDEAHHFRGKDSAQFKGALALSKRIPRVIQLTATPIKAEADDLYAQLRILAPDEFTSYHKFVDRFCRTLRLGWGVQVAGIKDREGLRRVMGRYALRRTYKDVGLELPKLIQPPPIRIRPPAAWYKVYRAIRTNYRYEDITFESAPAVLRVLRRATLDAKLPTLTAMATDSHGEGTVYFCWHRESTAIVAKHLNIPAITGELPPKERVRIAKAGGSIAATIASLSEGIDLSHLHNVVFVENSYLPGDHEQALARVRRWNPIGTPVRCLSLLVMDTIDTRISGVLGRRTTDVAAIVRDELTAAPTGLVNSLLGRSGY